MRPRRAASHSDSPLSLCLVEALLADGRVSVRGAGAAKLSGEARVAVLGYVASEGDRVLVSEADGELFVTGVVHAARIPALRLPDGGWAGVSSGALEVRDPDGRLVVRYQDGVAEIAPERGDLKLRAPAGAVRIEAATDVVISGARDVSVSAERKVEHAAGKGSRFALEPQGATLAARLLAVRAGRTDFVSGDAAVVVRALRTSATRIVTSAREIEQSADRVVLQAKDKLETISGVLETRAERARTLVKDLYSLVTGRTALRSKDDTSVDGKRVLLG